MPDWRRDRALLTALTQTLENRGLFETAAETMLVSRRNPSVTARPYAR
jgi:hypothetical protein